MWKKFLTLTILFFLMSANGVVADTSGDERVLIIGLDGADWDMINPLLEQGKLPNLEKLIEKGDRSNLTSSIPSMSPVAWTTFATGKNPGKHGVYSFLRKEGNDFVPLTADDITSEKMWDITSEKDLTSVVINVPMSYPPHEIKGKLISGYLSIENTTYTYPPSLQEEIEEKGYKIEALSEGFEPGKEDEFLEELNETVEKRTEIAVDLMDETDWNLSVVVYTGLDRLQHYFWKHMEKEDSEYESAIPGHYQKLDRQIVELLEEVNEDTRVIVMSDHGFGPLKGEVYLNHWLQKEGYLQLEDQGLLERLGLTQQNLATVLRKIKLFEPMKNLLEFLGLGGAGKAAPKPSYDEINFEETGAFAGNFGGGIYVTAENYEEVRNEVKNKLESLENPETGEKFFDEVYKKEEIYQGSMLDEAPDLVVDSENWDPVGYLGYSMLYSTDIEKSGKHRNEGILVTDFEIERGNNSLIDVSPTVLQLLNISTPEGMDGESLLK